jgi:hypothetical protein
MRITNTQVGPRGLNAISGPVMIDPGQSVEVEMSEAEAAIAEATGWFEFGKAEVATDPAGLTAKHVGGGAWFIMDGDERIGESMKKDDAEAFNAMSDEDKAAFVTKG